MRFARGVRVIGLMLSDERCRQKGGLVCASKVSCPDRSSSRVFYSVQPGRLTSPLNIEDKLVEEVQGI